MDKRFKESLRILEKARERLTDCPDDFAGEIVDDINTLFTHFMEDDRDFDHYLMGIHGKDYQGLDDDMPDKFDEWLSEMDTDTRYEYFISFINS